MPTMELHLIMWNRDASVVHKHVGLGNKSQAYSPAGWYHLDVVALAAPPAEGHACVARPLAHARLDGAVVIGGCSHKKDNETIRR